MTNKTNMKYNREKHLQWAPTSPPHPNLAQPCPQFELFRIAGGAASSGTLAVVMMWREGGRKREHRVKKLSARPGHGDCGDCGKGAADQNFCAQGLEADARRRRRLRKARHSTTPNPHP